MKTVRDKTYGRDNVQEDTNILGQVKRTRILGRNKNALNDFMEKRKHGHYGQQRVEFDRNEMIKRSAREDMERGSEETDLIDEANEQTRLRDYQTVLERAKLNWEEKYEAWANANIRLNNIGGCGQIWDVNPFNRKGGTDQLTGGVLKEQWIDSTISLDRENALELFNAVRSGVDVIHQNNMARETEELPSTHPCAPFKSSTHVFMAGKSAALSGINPFSSDPDIRSLVQKKALKVASAQSIENLRKHREQYDWFGSPARISNAGGGGGKFKRNWVSSKLGCTRFDSPQVMVGARVWEDTEFGNPNHLGEMMRAGEFSEALTSGTGTGGKRSPINWKMPLTKSAILTSREQHESALRASPRTLLGTESKKGLIKDPFKKSRGRSTLLNENYRGT